MFKYCLRATLPFIALLLVCSCNDSAKDFEPVLLEEQVMHYEGIGDVTVKLFQDENGLEYRDFGEFKNEVEAFLAENLSTVTIVREDENGFDITVLTSQDSPLYPNDVEYTESQGTNTIGKRFDDWSVTLYDDNFYQDRYLTRSRSFGQSYSDSDLKNSYSTNPFKKGFNDKTTSLKGTLSDFNSNKQLKVTLYDDKNFQDTQKIFYSNIVGNISHPHLGILGFNDKCSSYKVAVIII